MPSDPKTVIMEAQFRFKPVKTLCLFSGGTDSLTTTHAAMATGLCDGVVHINTGCGVPETTEFVKRTCEKYGWPLFVYVPPRDIEGGRGATFEWLVTSYGMPGPAGHFLAYNWLKDRPLRKVLKDFKTKRSDCIMFISGVRSQESARRMGHVEPIKKDGSRIWVAAVHDWSKLDCMDYLAKHEVERNPVSQLLHMSGECLCGAFAHKGELEEIRLWYPEVAASIERLQEAAVRAGVKRTRWGIADQKPKAVVGPMCSGCDGAATGGEIVIHDARDLFKVNHD